MISPTTIVVLIGGLCTLLIGVGLLGTLLGVRATIESFSSSGIGMIMAAYYAGYLLGTQLCPAIISRVGHIRAFTAFAALAAITTLAFGLWATPIAWFLLRLLNGAAVVGVYMVVESWLNEQTPTRLRGRVFASYMLTTLLALGGGQYLLLAYNPADLQLFAVAAILITLGIIPIATTRVSEPQIEMPAHIKLTRLFSLSPFGAIGALGAGVVNGIFWGMTPVFAQLLSMTSAEIAVLMSATIVGGAVLQYPIGHISDYVDRRTVLVLVAFAAALLSAYASYLVVENLSGLALTAFFYGGTMFSIYGLSVAHTNDTLDGSYTLSATRGLLFIYGLGAFAGPIVGGIAMSSVGPVGLPLLTTATLVLLGLFGLARMLQRPPPRSEDQSEFVPLVRTTPIVLEMYPESASEDPMHQHQDD